MPATSLPPESQAKILLVDDNPANLLALRAILDDADYCLVEARSGNEALKQLTGDEFAVVLLDVHMPGISGFETARLIRQHERSQRTPIIFLTAADISLTEVEEGYSLGAVDLLIKPFSPIILRAKARGFVDLFQERAKAKRESEQRFSRFMKHLPGLAWIKDGQGRYVYVNEAAEKAFRLPRAELYGKTDSEIFPAKTAQQFQQHDEQARASSSGVQVIETLEHEDGLRYSLVSKFPIPDVHGNAAFVGGMAIDITKQMEVEQALRDSEGRFRGLMEQAPFSIQIFSPDGLTQRVNQAWEQLWGIRLDQIADYNILQDQQLEANGLLPFIRRAFEGVPSDVPAIRYDPEQTIPHRSAHADPRRWVSAVAYPLKDDAGNVREVVIVHDDITARKHTEEALHESRELYRAIGESIDYGVWICDPQGKNIYASESFLRLVGLTQQQCSEFGWGSVLHPDDAEGTIAAWKECVRSGSAWDRQHRFKGVDGQWHYALARGVPVRNSQGVIVAFAGINLDIQRLKEVEDELRAADRRKDEFLATLAHELRNPLAPIRNSLQILKMPHVDEEIVQQTRDMMERQVHHLVRLVDDLLDVSRVMRGKIELRKEHIELATIVARAVETAQPLIEVQNHTLDISLPAESLLLDVDPVRLVQVVGNLLTNAAKYTDAGGNIWLTAAREETTAVLRIRDNGIGIAPEMLRQVFELFVQADHSSTKTQGGLGIGLTLVKNLIEMHGGSVDVSSGGLGAGSEFTIRLPLVAEQLTKREDVAAEEPLLIRSTGLRLLVVDDNRDAAKSLAMLLRLHGHEVDIANHGQQAIALASAVKPAAVFLDLGMPGTDGFEVARAIRALPSVSRTKLIALTGWGQEEDRRRTAAAGFDHHLVKPVEIRLLEDLIQSLRPM